MPHCAAVPRVLRGLNGLTLRPRNTTVEPTPVLRQGRRKTLNPASRTNLNIHERPVRKKKKTPKYETYERDRGIVPTSSETTPASETNILLALGLRPVRNGFSKMHVVDECEKPKSPVAAEPLGKNVAVSAATTTVDDASGATNNVISIPDSPKANGVCDSAGERSIPSSRRNSKENAAELIKEERLSPPLQIKTEPKVECSSAQDLTVTCTSSYDMQPKSFPSAKFISISMEQCQGSSSQNKAAPARKRSAKSTDSDDGQKRGRMDDREASVRTFIEQASSGSLDDLQRHADTLQQEIHGLSALARTKELEWNEIVHSKKLKEEMYLRLVRKKQIMMIMLGSGSRPPDDQLMDFNLDNRMSDLVTNDEVSLNRVRPRLPSNLTITKSQSGASQQLQKFLMQPQRLDQQHLYANGSARSRSSSGKAPRATPFPILPKPVDNGRQAGYQGPVRDVKSLIADFRQTHPNETIPKRGRRMKSTAENLVSSSRSVMNMSSIALGSGSQVRTVGSTSEETSRPSSADSSRSDAANAFKDLYVQYSKLSNSSSGKAPPPYPEVTLHPVLPGNSQSPPPTSSLLHGILTKQAAAAAAAAPVSSTAGTGQKTTAFSPTLARLLTTPDQPSTTTITTAARAAGTSASSSSANVSISELLSTSKTRNELTITPVVHAQPAKMREEVTASHDEDAEEQDRLVIDEGDEDTGETAADGNISSEPTASPYCQGCHARPAQFVCAGCGNQWYCSRNCQVTAWDEHSEVCAG